MRRIPRLLHRPRPPFGCAQGTRTYAVECCTDLAGGIWITLLDEIPGTGEPLEILDADALSTPAQGTRPARGPQCFYRVRVKWAP